MSQRSVTFPAAFERAQYVRIVSSPSPDISSYEIRPRERASAIASKAAAAARGGASALFGKA
jgi:hypothetical protein